VNPARPIVQAGSFVSADPGFRFRLVSQAADAAPRRGTVVFVHGFAEEMNKARRMAARMARLLASDGWRVVQRDLAGCGDSSGEFVAASWEQWVADVAAELADTSEGETVWVWGMRAGALLAAAALRVHPRVNLLLWQPVVSGAQHLQQFLRMHTGARIIGAVDAGGSDAPAQTLRAGSDVEIGGYQLGPRVAAGLEGSTLELPAAFSGRIVWLEVSSEDEPTLSPAAVRIAGRWRERGLSVETAALTGPPFWQTQEIAESEALLERTLTALRMMSGDESGRAQPSPAARASEEAIRRGGDDQVVSIAGGSGTLWGVLSRPPAGTSSARTAVLVIVGGPQYRVGSHRQFVLLARRLAAAGFPTLRFDYRGMGDSEGPLSDFEAIGEDIGSALDALCSACPDVGRIVVWGLCDGASAALMFATSDPRVAGIVAANPWVRSARSLAVARLRHYYAGRLAQREFWAKLFRGRLDWRASMPSFAGSVRAARPHPGRSAGADGFQARMARGLASFQGRLLLILSGNDLTAREFAQHTDSLADWRGLLAEPRVRRVEIADADHTFSRRACADAVGEHTIVWLRGIDAAGAARSDSRRGSIAAA